MQIENELKEILADAYQTGIYAEAQPTNENWNFDNWLERNKAKILALGKPEPLANNKQCDDNFICYLFESGRCSAKCHKPCDDIGCLAV